LWTLTYEILGYAELSEWRSDQAYEIGTTRIAQ
jgi:hypothetical protein